MVASSSADSIFVVRLSLRTAAASPSPSPSSAATNSVSFVRGKTADDGNAGVSISLSLSDLPAISPDFARPTTRRAAAAALSWARRGSVHRHYLLLISLPL